MKIITTILLGLIFLVSCKKQEIKKEESDDFKRINEYRYVKDGKDSLLLNPFEVFKKMKFELDYHDMEGVDILSLSGDDGFSFFVHNGFYNKFKKRGNTVTVKLEYYNGRDGNYLNRKLTVGNEYKVIFTYKTNELQNRYPFATEMFDSGYYIIDILPLDKKFPRQNESH